MKIEQIYTGCLAQGAYYIESEGEAAIVDPLREVGPYLEKARSEGARIKYVLETHFHADFVSGHLDLAQKTGATIVFGPTAKPNYAVHVAEDGEILPLGKLSLKVLHTPGHTMESTTYLLRDEQGKDLAMFTGDTLFIGDVGRPDLAVKTNLTKEDLAGHLYDSLRSKIMPLADEVVVYPGHGAGSACGKNLSSQTKDTLGNQKGTNYALRADMSREEFIREVTEGLLPPPVYFPQNARLNREGYHSLDEVMERGKRALTPTEFEALANEREALVLDTRQPEVFARGFIPNAVNIGIDGDFAPWVGALVQDINQPLLLIAEPGREEEVIIRLARVGYDQVLGYLQGGYEAWRSAGMEVEQLDAISAETFEQLFERARGRVIDVRRLGEYTAQHVEGAHNVPLEYLNQHLAAVPRQGPVYLYCAGGYRSMIAASMLKARGWQNLVNVAGGFKAIAQTSVPLTAPVCTTAQH